MVKFSMIREEIGLREILYVFRAGLLARSLWFGLGMGVKLVSELGKLKDDKFRISYSLTKYLVNFTNNHENREFYGKKVKSVKLPVKQNVAKSCQIFKKIMKCKFKSW